MPMIRLKRETMDLIRGEALPVLRFVYSARDRDDGSWDLSVDDDFAYQVAKERRRGESDDDVESRWCGRRCGSSQQDHHNQPPRHSWHQAEIEDQRVCYRVIAWRDDFHIVQATRGQCDLALLSSIQHSLIAQGA